MAINVRVTANDLTDADRRTLEMRLRLEGVECHTHPNGMVRVSHPQWGDTSFNSWGTVQQHYDEQWSLTYWGGAFRGVNSHFDSNIPPGVVDALAEGGLDANTRTTEGCGDVPVPPPIQRV